MNAISQSATETPLTLLTGFLGTGKTTLVNRVLTDSHNVRIGVLMNEFGQLAIDSDRLALRRGAVVELLNGCICCASGGDLLRGLNLLLESQRGLDAILIETSGLADPWPIMQALDQWRLASGIRLWSVITVVDAEHFDDNLDRAEAAFQQLTAADLVIINKCDLVDPRMPELLARSIGRINPSARTIATTAAEVPVDLVLDRRYEQAAATVMHACGVADSFQSAVVRVGDPVDPQRFDAWLRSLPDDVFRMKGSVHFAGGAYASMFDRVGRRSTLRALPNPESAPRGAQIVIIGKHLVPAELRVGLAGCVP